MTMKAKTMKTNRAKQATASAEPSQPATPRRRRRRRRRSSSLLSQRLITEINQKRRAFLREIGGMLTDALGFEVRVTLVTPKPDLSPEMRRASRMTKAQARRQMADSALAPLAGTKPRMPAKGDSLADLGL
jgi:hypothetical protein